MFHCFLPLIVIDVSQEPEGCETRLAYGRLAKSEIRGRGTWEPNSTLVGRIRLASWLRQVWRRVGRHAVTGTVPALLCTSAPENKEVLERRASATSTGPGG